MAVDLNNPAVLAAVVAAVGGVALKMTESWLNRSNKRTTEAQTRTDEMRKDIEDLKDRNATLTAEREAAEKEIVEWREKYFAIVEKNTALNQKILELLAELQALNGDKNKPIQALDQGPQN